MIEVYRLAVELTVELDFFENVQCKVWCSWTCTKWAAIQNLTGVNLHLNMLCKQCCETRVALHIKRQSYSSSWDYKHVTKYVRAYSGTRTGKQEADIWFQFYCMKIECHICFVQEDAAFKIFIYFLKSSAGAFLAACLFLNGALLY